MSLFEPVEQCFDSFSIIFLFSILLLVFLEEEKFESLILLEKTNLLFSIGVVFHSIDVDDEILNGRFDL